MILPQCKAETFYEIFRFGDEINPNQRTVTKGNHKIASKTKYNGSVVIPTKALLGDSGMKITIELYLSDGTRLKTNNCYIYPKKPETINPITYYSSTYTCRDTRASFISNKVFYSSESYTFTSVDDYFLNDLYYRLPIEQFQIDTSLSGSVFTCEDAYLSITGLNEYFPGLTFNNQNEAIIPLNIIYRNGSLKFAFRNTMYVESRLLIMSTTPKSGYVSTNRFYLPINHRDDLLGSSFKFVMEKVGLNGSTFMWESSLLTGSSLIGDCHNSGYCVKGTVSK